MTKAILFDCWGTLLIIDQKPHPFQVFAETIGKDADYDYMKIYEKHFMLSAQRNLDIPIKNFLDELNIKYNHNLINQLKQILEDSLDHAKAYPETLDQLKLNYKLCLITNTGYYGFTRLN